jgi:DNA-binding transcriptional LysR family regulator
MELRHLRYFLAVAEEGHVTRAAERLGIQQPPLSQQIQNLEAELDVQLFRRKPRGVELTDAGRSLLADAQIILAQVERARAKVGRTARGEQGTVVVGFTSSAPFHPFVPRIIREFRETYPGVTLVLQELGTGELVDGLRAEDIDVAFIRSPVPDPQGLTVHGVVDEEMFAALPNDHPLAPIKKSDAKALAIGDLAAEPFILYRRGTGPGFYDLIISACHRAGFTPQIAQEAPRILSTLNLVAAGLGVTMVPASLRALDLPGVAYRSLRSRPRLMAPLNLACRTVDHSTPARHFVAMVREAAKAIKI